MPSPDGRRVVSHLPSIRAGQLTLALIARVSSAGSSVNCQSRSRCSPSIITRRPWGLDQPEQAQTLHQALAGYTSDGVITYQR